MQNAPSSLLWSALVLVIAVGCGTSNEESEDDPAAAEGALSEQQSLANTELAITCQVLDETNECEHVSICKRSSEAKCTAKPAALAADALWGDMCPRHGATESTCTRALGAFCQWETTAHCVPNGNIAGGAIAPLGDRHEIACKALGETQQCGRVSICRSFSEAMCKAKASAVASDPRWRDLCPRAGVNERACGWQASFCTWEAVSRCVPNDR